MPIYKDYVELTDAQLWKLTGKSLDLWLETCKCRTSTLKLLCDNEDGSTSSRSYSPYGDSSSTASIVFKGKGQSKGKNRGKSKAKNKGNNEAKNKGNNKGKNKDLSKAKHKEALERLRWRRWRSSSPSSERERRR